jgi:iron complex transport system permease protein
VRLKFKPAQSDTGGVASGIGRAYSAHTRKNLLFVFLMIAGVCALCVVGLSVGGASFSISESWRAILAGPAQDPSNTDIRRQIIWTLRVPRVLTAIVSGVGLAVSGLTMQTILRNPLASPYTLGISAAASFGAGLGIVTRFDVFSVFLPAAVGYDLMIIGNSFIFTVICTFLIYFLSKLKKSSAETIVLFGVAMMFVFEAATSFLQYIGKPEELAELVYWMFGSLSKASWHKFCVILVCVIVCVLLTYRNAWNFNALMLGDESARSSGIHVERLRVTGLLLSSLMTAVIVSLLGPIGFIGLVAPHIGRMLVGGDHRFLVPTTCLAGAALLILADTLSCVVLSPSILPVGIMTSFVGVPLLIYLIMQRRREHW